MAKEEAEREAEFTKHLQEIEFQASRVRQIGRHARETIGDILQEKSLDLLGAMVGFFSGSLLYYRHGFFGLLPLYK
jgi:hypothetical protein